MEKQARKYYYFVSSFFILNLLTPFVITTEKLNRYITSFEYSFRGVFNSLVGNLVVLAVIVLLVHVFIKTNKKRMLALTIISFIIGGILFAINIYNRYYGTSFTYKAFAIFKNPPAGIGFTIFFESLRELFTYYRFILFIPFAVQLGILLKYKNEELIKYYMPLSRGVLATLMIGMLMFTNIIVFSSMTKGINIIESSKPTYTTQNIGIYNYLLLDAIGFDFDIMEEDINVQVELDKYNKNKDSYTNYLDKKTYYKNIYKKDVTNLSGKLVNELDDDDLINGILEDYNLVLIHLETFNSLLIENEILNKHFYNLEAILKESYVFNNFYTNVGIGNSLDAELSVLTGLYANGTSTYGWDFDPEDDVKDFEFQTLVKLFNNKNYNTKSYHGNDEIFYNRVNVHPLLFGFNEFHSKEVILENENMTVEEIQEKYDHFSNVWLSDRITFDYVNKEIKNEQEKFMKYIVTMLPHTPYYYDPYHEKPKETEMFDESFIKEIDLLSLKYFNYIKYYNEIFKILFENVDGYGDDYIYDENNLYNYNKTAFVFYGDHGSGIRQEDVNFLYNDSLSPLEQKAKLIQTTAFIYVPGEQTVTHNINGKSVSFKEGLFKGEQNLVRDQKDLYRTIIDLFNLELSKKDYLYGVNGLTNEPSFALDNKSLNLITDKFITNLSNKKVHYYYEEVEYEDLIDYIINFKQYSDLALNENLYRDFK